jgi:hypothetical protein
MYSSKMDSEEFKDLPERMSNIDQLIAKTEGLIDPVRFKKKKKTWLSKCISPKENFFQLPQKIESLGENKKLMKPAPTLKPFPTKFVKPKQQHKAQIEDESTKKFLIAALLFGVGIADYYGETHVGKLLLLVLMVAYFMQYSETPYSSTVDVDEEIKSSSLPYSIQEKYHYSDNKSLVYKTRNLRESSENFHAAAIRLKNKFK